MSEQKLFDEFVSMIQFDAGEYLVEGKIDDLPDNIKNILNSSSEILKQNIVGDFKVLGGSIKKNQEKFDEFIKKAEKEIENEKFKSIKKELKDYVKKLKDLIEKTCMAIMPIKEMPWATIVFQTVPRLVYDKKVQLLDNIISYCGEIKCVVSKTTMYGKMKGEDPLFAPFVGDLDLGGYKLDTSQKVPKSEIYSYVSAIINSFDSNSARSQLAKYHEGYQRHGEPICDFLLKDEELKKVMEKVTSGLDSKRITSDIAVCGIAVPQNTDNTSLMIVVDENSGASQDKYLNCFEAILKFSAACCEAPSTRKAGAPAPGQAPGGGVSTPGGQQLSQWTAEDLAKDAQSRGSGGVPPGMAVWSEDELAKTASERSSGLPAGMEYWKEEDLVDLAKKRQGGALDIPEWKPDPEMNECKNCGYAMRKGWDECPICKTPVGGEAPSKNAGESKPEPTPSKPEPTPSKNAGESKSASAPLPKSEKDSKSEEKPESPDMEEKKEE